jgi:hypothetical protein
MDAQQIAENLLILSNAGYTAMPQKMTLGMLPDSIVVLDPVHRSVVGCEHLQMIGYDNVTLRNGRDVTRFINARR